MNNLVEQIRIDSLELSFLQMRIADPKHVSRIRSQLFVHGQLQPVVVRRLGERYQVIDGLKRVYAAIDLGRETIECYVLDVDLLAAKVLVLSYNRSPHSMNVWEEALVLLSLTERHNLSQQRLSKLTGYSRSWVSRRLSLVSKLSGSLVNEIRMGTLSSSQARALIKLPRGNQAAVARVIMKWAFSSRQSDALADAFLNTKSVEEQQHLLAHPEEALGSCHPKDPIVPYNYDMSAAGNGLLDTAKEMLLYMQDIIDRLHPDRIEELTQEDSRYLHPKLETVIDKARGLIAVVSDYYSLKKLQRNER